MSLKAIAFIFGIIFLVVGVLGFVPGITQDGMLLNLFMVNTAHNIVHILTGLAALLAASRQDYSRLFFQVLGFLYGLVTILGFALNGDLFIMQVNTADNILHLVIAVVSLYLGFMTNARALREL